jgi:hemoglobin-like flavoprotein
MSPETERLIRESWREMEPHAAEFADLFYVRLFEVAPEVRAMFALADMDAQKRKFVDMLAEIVRVLDDPARLVGEVAASGSRHLDYGVQDRHYDIVGSALLWTLGQALGERFTPELREAWRETYGLLAAVMRRGAARASPPKPAHP